jgi:hypothetical protein
MPLSMLELIPTDPLVLYTLIKTFMYIVCIPSISYLYKQKRGLELEIGVVKYNVVLI